MAWRCRASGKGASCRYWRAAGGAGGASPDARAGSSDRGAGDRGAGWQPRGAGAALGAARAAGPGDSAACRPARAAPGARAGARGSAAGGPRRPAPAHGVVRSAPGLTPGLLYASPARPAGAAGAGPGQAPPARPPPCLARRRGGGAGRGAERAALPRGARLGAIGCCRGAARSTWLALAAPQAGALSLLLAPAWRRGRGGGACDLHPCGAAAPLPRARPPAPLAWGGRVRPGSAGGDPSRPWRRRYRPPT
jgi:hypothetical protein